MSTKNPEAVIIKSNNTHIQVMRNRLRISHALKLYYNRMHYWITNLPEGNEQQRQYFIREASETLLNIREIDHRIGIHLKKYNGYDITSKKL